VNDAPGYTGVVEDIESTTYSGFTWEWNTIPTVKCGEDRFGPGTAGRGVNLSHAWCPENLNISIEGNLGSMKRKAFDMGVDYCN